MSITIQNYGLYARTIQLDVVLSFVTNPTKVRISLYKVLVDFINHVFVVARRIPACKYEQQDT